MRTMRPFVVALATFVENRAHYKQLEVVAGLRLELIDFRFQNQLAMTPELVSGNYAVVIPGGGALYHVTNELSVLGGIEVPILPMEKALV